MAARTMLAIALAACEAAPQRDGGSSAASGIDTAESTDGGGVVDDGDDATEKLDVAATGGGASDGGDCPGGGAAGETEHSLIWIANSPQGTVSKIDTRSGDELARYFTGPSNGDDDPSRTSVNLVGDVAVANRAGSLTKIAATEDRCIDRDDDGAISTSTGRDDVLPFGNDECMLWTVALPVPDEENIQGPRPTAWDAGSGCQADDARVWTGWWVEASSTAFFRRFDGRTGDAIDDVAVPNYEPQNQWGYGPYGGAVDAAGNLWATGLHGPLLRIDGETLDVEVWSMPVDATAYGMAVDGDGHVWTAGVDGGVITHFDPATEEFDLYATPNGSLRGLAIDRNGDLWAAGNDPCGLVRFDIESRMVVDGRVRLAGCDTPVGVSIDADGFVWVPDEWANLAFKLDPSDYSISTTKGLVRPYTYSDMTGAGLGLVVFPPVG